MIERTILAVPGLERTSPEFRAALWDMAARNGWDADAIATVMSSESGFNPAIRNPKGTATGLIQFIESTAQSLGTSTAALAQMTAVEQLPFVEKYYRRAGITAAARPFDYYVVGLGQRPGLPLDYQVVSDRNYAVNASLDHDKDGKITVADMRDVFAAMQARAGGRRLDASPLAPAPATRAEPPAPALDSSHSGSDSGSPTPPAGAGAGDLRAPSSPSSSRPKAFDLLTDSSANLRTAARLLDDGSPRGALLSRMAIALATAIDVFVDEHDPDAAPPTPRTGSN